MTSTENTSEMVTGTSSPTPPVFCVINCEDSIAWKPVGFFEMFRDHLSLPGDIWISCDIVRGEPLPEDILSYNGVIISGSHFNVRDRESLPWFDSLVKFIRDAAAAGESSKLAILIVFVHKKIKLSFAHLRFFSYSCCDD